MRFGRLLLACGLFGLTAVVAAQDAAPVPSPFRSFIVADGRFPPKPGKKADEVIRDPRDRTGKQHDLVGGNGLNPTVAVFASVSKLPPDEPLSKLVKRLEAVRATYQQDQFGAFVVFTVLDTDYTAGGGKADEAADKIRTWVKAVQPGGVVIGLAKKPDDKDGPAKNWNLKPDTVTVVFFNRHNIVKRWDKAEGDLGDDVANEIAAVVDAEMKKK